MAGRSSKCHVLQRHLRNVQSSFPRRPSSCCDYLTVKYCFLRRTVDPLHNERRYIPKPIQCALVVPSRTFTQHAATPEVDQNRWQNFFDLIKKYEDLIGITEVKAAQSRVIEAEDGFSRLQEARREKQEDINAQQQRLKDIHAEFDKTSRGEDRYLGLLTQEHAVIKEEKQQLEEFRMLEKEERAQFNRLSSALRTSHEKEREYSERTKYWSITGSLIGAMLGLCGTVIAKRMTMKQLRGIVAEGADGSKVKEALEQLTDTVVHQRTQVQQFLNELRVLLAVDLDDAARVKLASAAAAAYVHPPAPSSDTAADLTALSEQGRQIVCLIGEKEQQLRTEMVELKRLLAADKGYSLGGDGRVMYVAADEVGQLLERTERSLEWKMKMQTVINVVLIYAALAVSVPLVYALATR